METTVYQQWVKKEHKKITKMAVVRNELCARAHTHAYIS